MRSSTSRLSETDPEPGLYFDQKEDTRTAESFCTVPRHDHFGAWRETLLIDRKPGLTAKMVGEL